MCKCTYYIVVPCIKKYSKFFSFYITIVILFTVCCVVKTISTVSHSIMQYNMLWTAFISKVIKFWNILCRLGAFMFFDRTVKLHSLFQVQKFFFTWLCNCWKKFLNKRSCIFLFLGSVLFFKYLHALKQNISMQD